MTLTFYKRKFLGLIPQSVNVVIEIIHLNHNNNIS